MRSAVRNFLVSGHEFSPSERLLGFRFAFFNATIAFIGVVLFLFALNRFRTNSLIVGFVDLTYALMLFWSIWKLRRSRESFDWISIFVIASTFVALAAATFVGKESNILAWYILFVVMAFIVGGPRTGFVAFGASCVALVAATLVLPEVYTPKWVITLLANDSIVTFMIYHYDRRVRLDHAYLLQVNESLEARVAERTADLSVAKEAAEAASRAKSAFLANMSHELRTPMNGILGMVELARGRMADDKGRSQLDKALVSADHLLSIINNILDLSKIEAERMTLEQADFAIDSVFERVSVLLGQKALSKGLQLDVQIAPELAGKTFTGDPVRLGQVLINLVANAIKFTDRGAVTVSATVADDGPAGSLIRFKVRDTGIGIDEEHRSRLFAAFEQADNTITRKYGGSGLGLAICRQLVRLMKGEIGVDSVPGRGSTFWFSVRLPRAKAQAGAACPATQAAESATALLRQEFPGGRVLLAEDEPINQEVTMSLLETCGLEVDLAEDGVAALDAARARPYLLILMDMQMPRMSGVEAAREIRAGSLNRGTPILALTANAFDDDREVCAAAGMSDHIGKPYRTGEMLATVLRWARHSAGRPQVADQGLPVPPAAQAAPDPEGGRRLLRQLEALLSGSDAAASALFRSNESAMRVALGDAYDGVAERIRQFDFGKALELLRQARSAPGAA